MRGNYLNDEQRGCWFEHRSKDGDELYEPYHDDGSDFRLRTPLDKSAELIFHNQRLSLLHDEPPSTNENASLQVLKLFFARLEAHLDDCINYGEWHTLKALKHPRLARWTMQELVGFARRV